MYFYLFLFLFICLFSFSFQKCKKSINGISLRLMTFILFFLPAAIRYGIGTDYFNYIDVYNQIYFGRNVIQEFSWKILNSLVIGLNLGEQFVFVLSSFLIYFFLLTIERKYYFVVVSLYFVFYYSYSFNCIRNAIAISLIICSYLYLIRGKYWYTLITLLLACFFHTSSYLYIPIFCLMRYVKLQKRFVIIASIVILIAFSFDIISIIFNSSFFKGSKYSVYYNVKYYLNTNLNSGIGVIFRIFILFLIYCLCDEKSNVRVFSYISYFFVVLLISILVATKVYILHRFLSCFYVGYIAIFLYLYEQKSGLYKKILIFICLLYIIGFELLLPLARNDNGIIPYITIFH